MNQTAFHISQKPDPHIQRRKDLFKKYPNEIRALMGNHPATIFWVIFSVVSQFAVAYLFREQSWPVIIVASFAIGAWFNHALYVFIHEATHNLIFKHSLANRFAGMFCDFALFAPASQAFRRYHLIHHNRQGQHDFDADIAGDAEADLVGNSTIKKFIWVFLMAVSQASRPSRLKIRPFFDAWIFGNLLLQIAVMAAAYPFLGVKGLVYLGMSTVFGLGLHPLGGRWIAEHFIIHEDQETYSYYGPLNKVVFNVGYHNEHHDVMTIAWVNLPKLRALAPEFYEGLVFHPSYGKLLWRFITDPNMNLRSRMIRTSMNSESELKQHAEIMREDGVSPELAYAHLK